MAQGAEWNSHCILWMPGGHREQKQTWQLVSALESAVPQTDTNRNKWVKALENIRGLFLTENIHTKAKEDTSSENVWEILKISSLADCTAFYYTKQIHKDWKTWLFFLCPNINKIRKAHKETRKHGQEPNKSLATDPEETEIQKLPEKEFESIILKYSVC